MVSFVVCGVLGQVLVLWWAHRRQSLFARRTAWASLALEGVLIVALVLLAVPAVLDLPAVFLALFVVVWLGQLALAVLAVVLAIRAWRGHEVADGPLPAWLTDRLPSEA
ncbi:MAG: hypothetical protein R2699_10365 [Acidimicrobiales bacterium]